MLLQILPVKFITYGRNSLIFKASLLRNPLPNEYIDFKSVDIFEQKIKAVLFGTILYIHQTKGIEFLFTSILFL